MRKNSKKTILISLHKSDWNNAKQPSDTFFAVLKRPEAPFCVAGHEELDIYRYILF